MGDVAEALVLVVADQVGVAVAHDDAPGLAVVGPPVLVILAPFAHHAADQLLVGADAVHVGGIEEGHPAIQRQMDRGDGLRLVAAGVEVGHPHAAEAEGGDVEALAAELACLQRVSPMRCVTVQ